LTFGEHGQLSINGLDPSIAVKQHPHLSALNMAGKLVKSCNRTMPLNMNQTLQQNHTAAGLAHSILIQVQSW
jgi:hypothetical protein